ncbi:hypothetical protein KC675_00785 [Candidatus Dojkabacteria bacterium]|uniref:Uncharacterized protein n=1 Tax=Candidatus Dojkabacteria bacterium TaxID=2099670 RepID=A0A955IDM3_9BACT|nr:hypothetical protein [Candidatus Dojkabacteria bacterium]
MIGEIKEPGLYDRKGNPIELDSPGVVGNRQRAEISNAIAGGLIAAGEQGQHQLAENAAGAIEDIATGDEASKRN